MKMSVPVGISYPSSSPLYPPMKSTDLFLFRNFQLINSSMFDSKQDNQIFINAQQYHNKSVQH